MCCCLCLVVGCNKDKIERLEAENRELVAKLAAANLDLQDKCSKQARVRFASLSSSQAIATFTNHYNAKLNKCFALVNQLQFTGGKMSMVGNVLVDAYEGKEFAHYVWHDGNVTRCDMVGIDGKACTSLEQFKKIIKPYMEEYSPRPE